MFKTAKYIELFLFHRYNKAEIPKQFVMNKRRTIE